MNREYHSESDQTRGLGHNYTEQVLKERTVYRHQPKNLLFCRFPKAEKQTVVHKTFQFLTVSVIANAYNRNFGNLDASNKVSNSTSISSRHPINLIHNQHSFRMLWPAISTINLSRKFNKVYSMRLCEIL
jgi:hypothetical protein